MEEKEKEESTGRDRCGAHTHSLTLSHSLRARLARSHTRREPRSAQDPERRGKVAPAFSPGLRALGRALAPRLRRACGILPSRLRTSGAPAAAASAPGTVGGLDNNSGGRLRPGAPSRCPPRSRDPSRPLPPPDARLPACNASARERLLPCPPWGLSRAPSAKSIPPAGVGRGAGAEPAAPSRADPGTYKAGAVPGRDAGRSCALCHERRLAAPGPGLAAPGRPGRPGQTPAGRGRRGGRGGQVPAPLRVLEPPGLPQPPRLALQSAAAARRAGGWRRLRERAGAQPHRRLPAAAPGGARACVPGAVHPHRPGAALQGRRPGLGTRRGVAGTRWPAKVFGVSPSPARGASDAACGDLSVVGGIWPGSHPLGD